MQAGPRVDRHAFRQPARLDVPVLDEVVAVRLVVVESDPGILEFEARDAELERSPGGPRFLRLRVAPPQLLEHVGPVVGPGRIDLQVQLQTVHGDAPDLHAVLREQRPQPDADAGLADRRERDGAEPRPVGDRGGPGLHGQPRQQAHGQAAGEVEFAPRRALEGRLGVAAVIVGIEPQPDRHDRDPQEADRDGERNEQDLLQRGPVPCLGKLGADVPAPAI